MLWAMPRTGSSGLIKEYCVNNNLKPMKKHWEPFTVHGTSPAVSTPLYKMLTDTIFQEYTFKVMTYMPFTYEKYDPDPIVNTRKLLNRLNKEGMYNGYQHMYLFRRDAAEQLKSYIFSIVTNVWEPFTSRKSDEQLISRINNHSGLRDTAEQAYAILKTSMENMAVVYRKCIRDNGIVQLIEMQDVIEYVPSIWNQETNHLYDQLSFPDLEAALQKELERKNFYNDYFAN